MGKPGPLHIYSPLKDPGAPAAMTDEQLLKALSEREVANDELSQLQLSLIYGLHGEGRLKMSIRIEDGQRRVYWRRVDGR